jgi:hypothetical protein
MLGSGGSLFIMILLVSYVTLGILLVLSSMKVVDNVPCREGTGWLEKCCGVLNGQDVKKILICFRYSK